MKIMAGVYAYMLDELNQKSDQQTVKILDEIQKHGELLANIGKQKAHNTNCYGLLFTECERIKNKVLYSFCTYTIAGITIFLFLKVYLFIALCRANAVRLNALFYLIN